MKRFLLLLWFTLSTTATFAQPVAQAADGDNVVCATPDLMELYSGHTSANKSRRLLLSDFCDGRTNRQHAIVSDGGHFRIHFDTIGPDSVSSVDLDANGIPDYIDSMAYYLDYAWRIEIDDYGYAAPPPDNLNPGQGGDDGLLDVYVCDLPPFYYGGAVPDPLNPIPPNRNAGYIALDNNYTDPWFKKTRGIEALRVTTAHELHHIIQFASYRFAPEQIAFYEATSVWFERQVHPDLNDFRQYIDAFLLAPQDHPFSTHDLSDRINGYAHEIFMEYVAKEHGRDIVRKMWEEFRTRDCFDAIDAALRTVGNNLENSYCELARWSYYTGYRAHDTTFFREAQIYPAMLAAITAPFFDGMILNGSMRPLAFELLQTTLATDDPNVHDTLGFLATNARADIGAGGLNLPDEPFTIELQRAPGVNFIPVRIKGDTIYYRFTTSNPHYCIDAIAGDINVTVAARSSPQPFINDGVNRLVISIGATNQQVTSATAWIYSSGMTPVRTIKQLNGLEAYNNQLGVVWDGRDENGEPAPTGVYIYQLSINGHEPVLGKITVVRR